MQSIWRGVIVNLYCNKKEGVDWVAQATISDCTTFDTVSSYTQKNTTINFIGMRVKLRDGEMGPLHAIGIQARI